MIDITDESYESDLTEEESNELLLMCGHAIGPQLSSAAQAVLDAFRTSHTGQGCLAAALRAAADQIVPETVNLHAEEWLEHPTWVQVESRVRLRLLAIADELEAQ